MSATQNSSEPRDDDRLVPASTPVQWEGTNAQPYAGHNLEFASSLRETASYPADTDNVCDKCREIDFQKIVDVSFESLHNAARDGILIADLGTKPTNGCPLCRFFFRHRCSLTYPAQKRYQLRVFSYLKFTEIVRFSAITESSKKRVLHDMPCLGVLLSGEEADKAEFEHTGHIFLLHESQRYNQSFFEPKLLRPCFDHELAKHWLDYCSKNHKSCQDDADEVEVLKLIDCSLNSPAVVPAPRAAKYIALSYVWGSPKKLPDVQTADLSPDDSKFSKTIRDAITATQQLGVQYLWVDKHCINQDDAQEKHNQISRMDRIYRGAVATIIAVAGNNADHGLPGVGDTFREQQPVAICQDFTLMSTMTHPHSSITSSSWNSRAWTFQESVLSRRRLVFTENQIYFECDVMNCVESLPPRLDLVHETPDSMYKYFHAGVLGGRERFKYPSVQTLRSSYRWKVARYNKLVNDYRDRTLSYHTDAYNAFAGIDRHLSQNEKYPRFWTIPHESECNFVYGLLWYHIVDDWDEPASLPLPVWNPKSKENSSSDYVPSWSHISWRGGGTIVVDDYLTQSDEDTILRDLSLEFNLKEKTSVEPVQWWIEKFSRDDISLPAALHFEVPVLDAKLFAVDISGQGIKFHNFEIFWHLSENLPDVNALWCRISGGEIELLLCLAQTRRMFDIYLDCLVTQKHPFFSTRIGTAYINILDKEVPLHPDFVPSISQMQKIRLR